MQFITNSGSFPFWKNCRCLFLRGYSCLAGQFFYLIECKSCVSSDFLMWELIVCQ